MFGKIVLCEPFVVVCSVPFRDSFSSGDKVCIVRVLNAGVTFASLVARNLPHPWGRRRKNWGCQFSPCGRARVSTPNSLGIEIDMFPSGERDPFGLHCRLYVSTIFSLFDSVFEGFTLLVNARSVATSRR